MVIGIDLDNTIACYDEVFIRLAEREGIPIDSSQNTPKAALAAALRARPNGELAWSLLQGEAYGPSMIHARPYPGFLDFAKRHLAAGHRLVIISHKTRFPSVGKPYPLQQYATKWIRENLSALGDAGFDFDSDVFLEETVELKVARIGEVSCDYFIDDLAEILDDPNFPTACQGVHFTAKGESSRLSFVDWSELVLPNAGVTLATGRKPASLSLSDKISALLGATPEKIIQLDGGINSDAYELHFRDRNTVFIKQYKSHQTDRIEREVAFLRHANRCVGDRVPSVIAFDAKLNLLALSYLPGSPVTHGSQIPANAWEQCFTFLRELQTPEDAAKLLPSAEGSASLQQHLGYLTMRRNRWLAFSQNHPEGPLSSWIEKDLETAYQSLARLLIPRSDFKRRLDPGDLIASPSDFGLHNCKLSSEGKLLFFDFEYAGWDDPAKTLADFFCQPRFPAPVDSYNLWKERIASLLPEDSRPWLLERIPVVDLSCRLKWIYIILAKENAERPLTERSLEQSRKLAGDLQLRLASVTDKVNALSANVTHG